MLGKHLSTRPLSLVRVAAVILAAMVTHATNHAKAGVIDAPFVFDSFGSTGDLTVSILPRWSGLPVPYNVPLVLRGPTTVQRETSPFVQGGRDTIDTEIVSMQLVGAARTLGGPIPVELRAGAGNGLATGLSRSGGQVQDKAGSPQDLVIDFPADSFFDVFFDLWVDLDTDTIIEAGELLRSSDALRMRQENLPALPPEPGTQFVSEDIVDADDPNIGMFNATMFLAGPLLLFPIDPMTGAVIDDAHSSIDPIGGVTHTVAEPGTLAILGLGLAALGFARRRKAA